MEIDRTTILAYRRRASCGGRVEVPAAYLVALLDAVERAERAEARVRGHRRGPLAAGRRPVRIEGQYR